VLPLSLALPAWTTGEAVMGDDGLHKTDWMRDTYKDLPEDLSDANANADAKGKRLMIIVEQRSCIYCNKMRREVFPIPEIDAYLHENYRVDDLNRNM
jgi:thioredoxin-related protein